MSSALNTVLRLKRDAEKQASDAVIQAAAQVTQLDLQLSQMRQYQREYLSNWQVMGREGVTGSQNQSWHRFIGQLEQTIGQLQQHLWQAQDQEKQQRARWHEARNEIRAVELLLDKRQQEERLKQERQEMKLLDELSGIRHFHQTRGR